LHAANGIVEHAIHMAPFFFLFGNGWTCNLHGSFFCFFPWGEEERQEVGMRVPPQEFP
jgi:hypothetical protein